MSKMQTKTIISDAAITKLIQKGMDWYEFQIANDSQEWFGDECFFAMDKDGWGNKELPTQKHIAKLVEDYFANRPYKKMAKECASSIAYVFDDVQKEWLEDNNRNDERGKEIKAAKEAKEAIINTLNNNITTTQFDKLKKHLKTLNII